MCELISMFVYLFICALDICCTSLSVTHHKFHRVLGAIIKKIVTTFNNDGAMTTFIFVFLVPKIKPKALWTPKKKQEK